MNRLFYSIALCVWLAFASTCLAQGKIVLQYSPRNTEKSTAELRYINTPDECFRVGWGPWLDRIAETVIATGIKEPVILFARMGGVLPNTNEQFDEFAECRANPATSVLGDPILFARDVALFKRKTKASEIIVYIGTPSLDPDFAAARDRGARYLRRHIVAALSCVRAANVSIAFDAAGGGQAGQGDYDVIATLLSEGRSVYVEPNPARKHPYDLAKLAGAIETPNSWDWTVENPDVRVQKAELRSHILWLNWGVLPWWSMNADELIDVTNHWLVETGGDVALPGAAAQKIIDAGKWPSEWN